MRILLVGMMLLLAGCAQSDEAQMAQQTNSFYGAYMTLQHDGIPNEAARAKLAGFVSPGLNKLLADGEAAEARYAKETKNQSPPIVEGDLFTSLFEGATAFRVGACKTEGDKGHCAVGLLYDDKTDKTVNWTDTVYLVRADQGWRVDDIAYGGHWAFGNKGRLTQTLKYAVKAAGETAE